MPISNRNKNVTVCATKTQQPALQKRHICVSKAFHFRFKSAAMHFHAVFYIATKSQQYCCTWLQYAAYFCHALHGVSKAFQKRFVCVSKAFQQGFQIFLASILAFHFCFSAVATWTFSNSRKSLVNLSSFSHKSLKPFHRMSIMASSVLSPTMKKSSFSPALYRPLVRYASIPSRDHTSLLSLWSRLSFPLHSRLLALAGAGDAACRLLVVSMMLLSLTACRSSRQATSASEVVANTAAMSKAAASSLWLDSAASNLAVQFEDLDLEMTFSWPGQVSAAALAGDTLAAGQNTGFAAGMLHPIIFAPELCETASSPFQRFSQRSQGLLDESSHSVPTVTLHLRSSHAAIRSEGEAVRSEHQDSQTVDSLRVQSSESSETLAPCYPRSSHAIGMRVAIVVIFVLAVVVIFCLMLLRVMRR